MRTQRHDSTLVDGTGDEEDQEDRESEIGEEERLDGFSSACRATKRGNSDVELGDEHKNEDDSGQVGAG